MGQVAPSAAFLGIGNSDSTFAATSDLASFGPLRRDASTPGAGAASTEAEARTGAASRSWLMS